MYISDETYLLLYSATEVVILFLLFQLLLGKCLYHFSVTFLLACFQFAVIYFANKGAAFVCGKLQINQHR